MQMRVKQEENFISRLFFIEFPPAPTLSYHSLHFQIPPGIPCDPSSTISLIHHHHLTHPPPPHSSSTTTSLILHHHLTHSPPPSHSSTTTSLIHHHHLTHPSPPSHSSSTTISLILHHLTHPPPPSHSSFTTISLILHHHLTHPPPPSHSSFTTSTLIISLTLSILAILDSTSMAGGGPNSNTSLMRSFAIKCLFIPVPSSSLNELYRISFVQLSRAMTSCPHLTFCCDTVPLSKV